MGPLDVHEAGPGDIRAIADVLGRAFRRDPIYRWLYPDPSVRSRRLGRLMDTYVRHLHAGMGMVEVAVDGDTIVGAAVWDRPGSVQTGGLRTAKALPGLLRAVGGDLQKLAALGEVLERHRPDDPHWYLFHLGVDPDRQRTGAGGLLLRSMLTRCDTTGVGAYLECCDANVGYYRAYGFEPFETVVVDRELSVRTMWRESGPLRPSD